MTDSFIFLVELDEHKRNQFIVEVDLKYNLDQSDLVPVELK